MSANDPRPKSSFRSLAHWSIERAVNLLAWIKRERFPQKYPWSWKLDAMRGAYEPETVCVIRERLKPGMTVVDIGAHIGYFARLFSACVGKTGRVYAFEADPSNFSLLKFNTFGKRNIQISPLAVSDAVGTVDFFESATNTGCHSLVPGTVRTNKISVQCTTLDALLEKGVIRNIDLIKMDIEGGEPGALRGMQRLWDLNPHMTFIFEFHPENLKAANVEPSAFLRTFTDRGYQLSAITAQGLTAINPETYELAAESINLIAVKPQALRITQETAEQHVHP
ncbi:MAG TPA: FkbM family methyltransferase [Patescibacteria group bacterium]|nr:FkbM family methyltransferase [Patescibacteria group bacterium]